MSQHRINISVAFYHNDSKPKESGLVGWFKGGMEYWHTEVAFPMSMYRRIEASGGKTSGPSDDRLFAYGVFGDHVDIMKNTIMVGRDSQRMVFDIDRGRQRLTIVASKGWKDKTPATDIGERMYIRVGETVRPVEEFESKGKVDVLWAKPERSANRFIRKGQSWAKLTISHSTNMVKLVLPGIVFGKPREFSNPAYQWIHLNVPYENAVLAAQFAEQQVGKPHDLRGIYWAMIWPRTINYETYYCVNLVAAVLQKAGMIQGTNPCYLLPDDLYHLIEHHPDRIVAANPHDTAQLWKDIGKPRTYSSTRRISSPTAQVSYTKKKKRRAHLTTR